MTLPRSLSLALATLALSACGYVTEEETRPLVPPATGAGESSAAAPAADAATSDAPAAPGFSLPGSDGSTHTLEQAMDADKIVVLEWFNPECPVVQSYHNPGKMLATYEAVAGDDLVWLAINSGGSGRQGHGEQKNQDAIARWSLPYPVLFDESGDVGHAYGARTTPHIFVLRDGRIVYQGAIDDSKSGREGVNFVQASVASLRAGEAPKIEITKPFGCSVKYSD
ncbi:MAG: thioredoxin family protein [Planctomycetota bacterium]|nr:MAG: thioredoxin family protein [Planctomycetota bacterium]